MTDEEKKFMEFWFRKQREIISFSSGDQWIEIGVKGNRVYDVRYNLVTGDLFSSPDGIWNDLRQSGLFDHLDSVNYDRRTHLNKLINRMISKIYGLKIRDDYQEWSFW